jgi:hypothetical protein
MTLIVAARFDSFDEAENAARRLFSKGFSEEAVNIFFVNPPGAHDKYPVGGDRAADPDARGATKGAVLGAGLLATVGAVIGAGLLYAFGRTGLEMVFGAAVGAYLGSLAGALSMAGRRSRDNPRDQAIRVRHAGVLTAVHVQPEQETQVAQVLRDAGGKDVEHAQGRWREGRWVDFDPLVPPEPSSGPRA